MIPDEEDLALLQQEAAAVAALVSRVLTQNRGNRVTAAKTLGLHEKSLIRLIRALGIHS